MSRAETAKPQTATKAGVELMALMDDIGALTMQSAWYEQKSDIMKRISDDNRNTADLYYLYTPKTVLPDLYCVIHTTHPTPLACPRWRPGAWRRFKFLTA